MSSTAKNGRGDLRARTAMRFVILLGIISLFGDMTYEGARSITGPYLATLGATGAIVGIVAGLGELIGYGLRLVSGFISDRTGRYWPITITGYVINLLAVPALALAHHWEVAAALIIAERTGKALRTPARDAMLSHATAEMGRGWGFGLHEAMDQTGAMLGPLLVAGVLWRRDGDYRAVFAFLFIPAVAALCTLAVARVGYPDPGAFEKSAHRRNSDRWPRAFWIYLGGIALVGAGYVDFPLIAFHFQQDQIIGPSAIPLYYVVGMAASTLAALGLGRAFDRRGFGVVILAAVIPIAFAPMVFLGGSTLALLGMALWGIGMAAQESIVRAVVADMIPPDRRASGYGVFNAGFGFAWFLGSSIMGILYDRSIGWLVFASVAFQITAIPLLLAVWRSSKRADLA